jgi:hypothetical protein
LSETKTESCVSQRARRFNGVSKNDVASARARGNGAHTSPKTAAKHDDALLALMRANSGASLTEIIRMNGRPRNSTVSSLKQLEKAGPRRARGAGQVDRGRP